MMSSLMDMAAQILKTIVAHGVRKGVHNWAFGLVFPICIASFSIFMTTLLFDVNLIKSQFNAPEA